MQIQEYGDKTKERIILIHGFQTQLNALKQYINYLAKDYLVVVPVLPGHNICEKEEFVSFDQCLHEFERYYIEKHGREAKAIIAFSMGGVFAGYIWKSKNLHIDMIIMESAPLLRWNRFVIYIVTRQYLRLTRKTRAGNKRVIQKAMESIVREEDMGPFLEMMDHMSDETIVKYIKEVGRFHLPKNINTPNTAIYYFFGGAISESVFRKVGKFIKKHYSNAYVSCIKGKRHCEDAIFDPEKKVRELERIIKG